MAHLLKGRHRDGSLWYAAAVCPDTLYPGLWVTDRSRAHVFDHHLAAFEAESAWMRHAQPERPSIVAVALERH